MTRTMVGAALLAAVMTGRDTPTQGQPITVRLTHYGWESCAAWPCRYADSELAHEGSDAVAVSSWLLPFGSVVMLPSGRTGTVRDRGPGLEGQPWIDWWCGSDRACQQEIAALGPYTKVDVLRVGWGY